MRILRYRAKSSLPVEIFSFPEELQAGPGEGIRGKIEELGNVTFKTVGQNTKLDQYVPDSVATATFEYEAQDLEGTGAHSFWCNNG